MSKTCERCNGKGEVPTAKALQAWDIYPEMFDTEECPDCKGSGSHDDGMRSSINDLAYYLAIARAQDDFIKHGMDSSRFSGWVDMYYEMYIALLESYYADDKD